MRQIRALIERLRWIGTTSFN